MSWLAGLFGDPFDGGQTMWDIPDTSSALTALQRRMTFASMANTIMAGGQDAFANFSAARSMDRTMEMEAKASEDRAKQISSEVMQLMGGQMVAFAASGVDPTSGSAAKVAVQTFKRGKQALEVERDNASLAMMRAGWRAASYRGGAINGLLRAGMSAYGQYMNTRLDVARRG